MEQEAARSSPDPFKWVGGCLCVDFVNTVGGRVHEGSTGDYRVRADKLRRLEDLETWERGPEGRPAGGREARVASSAGRSLRRAIALREALYRLFRATIRGAPVRRADLDLLSAEVKRYRARQSVVARRGRVELVVEGGAPFPEILLGRVAESALELLTGSDRDLLRQCPGEECGWLFLDRSRSGRRRWCDMRDCGNRAKVGRFRRRARKTTRRP